MEFRTELTITPKPMIDHRSKIVTAGSCFSDNIGQKLSENKFHSLVNPLGVCYNPISIHKGLMMTEPVEDLYVESLGLWKHFDFHSKFNANSKEELRRILVNQLMPRVTDTIMITYGTAWVYRHKATNKIVANCHKRPQVEFEKVLLTIDDVVRSFGELRQFTTQKIILTLSPVRHIKDTLELNSVSKAILRSAIHEIQNSFEGVDYFPAYEVMIDDLRDYRFYEADMIHPTDVAIDYIWKKFGERYFSEETKELNVKWNKVARSLNHRVFNEGTEQYRAFLASILKDLNELKSQIDVSKEITATEGRLNA
jgi:hypothetical protein